MPVFLVYVYSGVIVRVRGESNTFDGKQLHDMTRAASTAYGLSVPAMIAVYLLCRGEILHGLVWLPIYICFTIAAYSVCPLASFKRG